MKTAVCDKGDEFFILIVPLREKLLRIYTHIFHGKYEEEEAKKLNYPIRWKCVRIFETQLREIRIKF